MVGFRGLKSKKKTRTCMVVARSRRRFAHPPGEDGRFAFVHRTALADDPLLARHVHAADDEEPRDLRYGEV